MNKHWNFLVFTADTELAGYKNGAAHNMQNMPPQAAITKNIN